MLSSDDLRAKTAAGHVNAACKIMSWDNMLAVTDGLGNVLSLVIGNELTVSAIQALVSQINDTFPGSGISVERLTKENGERP